MLETKDILEIYRNIPNIFKIIEDTNLFDEAMDEYVKYDSDISFFDAIYVTVMKKENIHELISFDEDFDRVDGIVRIH